MVDTFWNLNQDNAPARRARRRGGATILCDAAKLAGAAPIADSRALNTPEHFTDFQAVELARRKAVIEVGKI